MKKIIKTFLWLNGFVTGVVSMAGLVVIGLRYYPIVTGVILAEGFVFLIACTITCEEDW